MIEDCPLCESYDLDYDTLCSEHEDCHYNWEEQEYSDNQAFYEYEGNIQLDKLVELPHKEKIK